MPNPRLRKLMFVPNNYYLPKRLIDSSTLIEDFETTIGWTVTFGSILDDAIHYRTGTQSIEFMSGLSDRATATKTVNLSNLGQYTAFRISIYLSSAVNTYSGILITFVETGGTKYITLSIPGATLHPGWNSLNIMASSGILSGGALWTDTFTTLSISPRAQPGLTLVVSVDTLEGIANPHAAVLMTFDDGYEEIYTNAYPVMLAKQQAATFYIPTFFVGAVGRCTIAQLSTMNNNSWDIGNHTWNHPDLTTLSQADAQTQLLQCKQDLDGWGLTRASKHVAYPLGAYNDTVIAAMIAEGMLTGRTTDVNRQPVLPVGNVYKVECQNIPVTTNLATAKGYINTAIANKSIASILFHKIVTGVPAAGEWALSDFSALCDYILSLNVQTITISELYALQSGPITVYHK